MSNSLQPHGLQPARLLCPWRFSRQEHWSGFPFPPPGDLPNPDIKPLSPALQADSLPSELPGKMCPNPRQPRQSASAFLILKWGCQDICMGLLWGLNTVEQLWKNQNHMCSEDGGPGHGWGRWEERGMHLAESALFIYLDPGLRLYINCRFNSV